MRDAGLRKVLWIGLGLAVVIYGIGFTLDQHLRHRRGAWRVTFAGAGSTGPALTVEEPSLGIREVRIEFAGEGPVQTNATVVFDSPGQSLPFGRVKYEDLTYLPGVVTLELFGHEIELLPRVLYVNRAERRWEPGMKVVLRPEDRPGVLPPPPKPRRFGK